MVLNNAGFGGLTKANVFVVAAFFSITVTSLAQGIPPKPLPKEPLEKYDEASQKAPVYVFRTDVSAAMVSQQGPFTSYQVNVSAGQNITNDAANEPSICVDPTNRNRMAIGWRQFANVGSNFRQAGRGFSSNGGLTWTFPGVLESVFRSDPVLASDRTGRFFYLSLLQNFFDDMWRSLDRGSSWVRLAQATGGDKQWFTIDTTNSVGSGFQYQAWSTAGNNYNGRQFSRSTNGGVSWLDPVNIPNTPVWGTLDVDTDGNVFVGGVNPNTNQNWCIRSSNAKNPAVTPTFDRSTPVNLGGTVTSGDSINPEGITGQIFLAIDHSGTSTNNYIYMLSSVRPAGAGSGAEVMIARSRNGGQSFEPPRRINTDPANTGRWHWFGTLSVAPNGRVDVVWLDTRNSTNNFDSQLFYSYSVDGGTSWSPEVAVSRSFNPLIGYPQQNKIGDYMTIVSDNIGGNVAYPATFNGEQDVYYVRVAPVVPVLLGDFNGDSSPDYLLSNPATRRTAIWYLQNNRLLNGSYGPTLPAGWKVACVADVNGDTKLDYILFEPVGRRTAVWFLNNGTYVGGSAGPTLPVGWRLIAATDFNHDNHPDFALTALSSRQTAVWFLNGTTRIGTANGPTLPAGWTLVDALDLNANGSPDFLLANETTRQTSFWYLNGAAFAGGVSGPSLPAGWTLQRAADFNHDTKPDYLLLEPNSLRTAIWYLAGPTHTSGAFGPTLPAGY